MKYQRGVTLGGVFFFMMLIGFAAYSAARVLPAYMDYWVVKKIMRNVVDQPNLNELKESDLRLKFAKERKEVISLAGIAKFGGAPG